MITLTWEYRGTSFTNWYSLAVMKEAFKQFQYLQSYGIKVKLESV